MNSLCITGANGFVGQALCSEFSQMDCSIRGAVRHSEGESGGLKQFESIVVGDISYQTDWSAALSGVDCIIHCAAMTQHRDRTGSGRLAAYRQVNVGGTVSLAKHAIAAGVKRLIYLSSIKVHGEGTLGAGGIPSSEGDDRFIFKNSDSVSPTDPYAISKWEAENALWELSTQSGLEVVVIRSPLIYGPGVKGNLARLMRLIEKNIPLPFGAINNSRSLIGLDNLIDLIRCCVRHPSAPSNTLLVRDGHDISTPELLHHIATAQGVPLRLFSVPVSVLRAVGLILGRSEEIDRLIGCMRIDDKFTRDLLSWSPPQTVEYGVARMVQLK